METETTEKMTAGRETDFLVADALGWTDLEWGPGALVGQSPDGYCRVVPYFSTDEGAVVKALMTFRRWSLECDEDGQFGACVWTSDLEFECAFADTLPLAICKAILAAKEQPAKEAP